MLPLLLALSIVAQATADMRLDTSGTIPVELNKLKGTLVRQLAWSPDQSELYLMTYEPNRDASIKAAYHFVVTVANGATRKVDAPPDWAVAYWTWKSHHTAPGEKTPLRIEVLQERRRQDAVAVPFGDDAARGGTVSGSGTSQESAVRAANAMQMNDVYTLKLHGQVVGEWVNHPIVPGLTFGWGPKDSGLIAFAEKGSGKLVIMDRTGKTQKIDGSRDVVLPAWSDDGARLAYLEDRGRGRYVLVVATVSR